MNLQEKYKEEVKKEMRRIQNGIMRTNQSQGKY